MREDPLYEGIKDDFNLARIRILNLLSLMKDAKLSSLLQAFRCT